MKKTILSTLCVGVLSLPAMADILDDNKQGFLIGLGIGLTSISTELNFNNTPTLDERAIGMATSFKIGYAFNEQFSVYYTNQVDWYTFKDSSTQVGLTGIGTDYYFTNTSGLYATGMLGFGSISNLTDNGASTGSGFGLGIGYDLLPHMSVEAAYMHINIEENNAELYTDSLRMKFQYTWY